MVFSPSPTEAPTFSPCPEGSVSIDRWHFPNFGCDILASRPNYCEGDVTDGLCDETCGYCRALTDSPTVSPSAAPSLSPTVSPTCAPGSTSVNLLSDAQCQQAVATLTNFCVTDIIQGACDATCEYCRFPTTSPTASPTVHPTSAPSAAPNTMCTPGRVSINRLSDMQCNRAVASLVNFCQNDIAFGSCDMTCGFCRSLTDSPTAAPTANPTASPTTSPTDSPTAAPTSLCLPGSVSINRLGNSQCELFAPSVPEFCTNDINGACDRYCGIIALQT